MYVENPSPDETSTIFRTLWTSMCDFILSYKCSFMWYNEKISSIIHLFFSIFWSSDHPVMYYGSTEHPLKLLWIPRIPSAFYMYLWAVTPQHWKCLIINKWWNNIQYKSRCRWVTDMWIKHVMCTPVHVLLTALHLLAELGHVVWPYGVEELDVVVTVVFSHLLTRGFVWPLQRNITCVGWWSVPGEEGTAVTSFRKVTNLHRSPFSCTGHSSEAGCESSGCDVVSWDVLVHSNNFQCHL